MSSRKRISIVVKFTLVVLAIIVFIAASLSAVFLYNLYTITYDVSMDNVERSVGRQGDQIEASMRKYVGLLENADHGVTALLRYGWIPPEEIADFFLKIMSSIPEVEMLYFTNNSSVNSPGG